MNFLQESDPDKACQMLFVRQSCQYGSYLFPKPKDFKVLCLASGLSLPFGVRYLLGSNISGSAYSAALIALFLVAQLKESASSCYIPGVENDNAPYRAIV